MERFWFCQDENAKLQVHVEDLAKRNRKLENELESEKRQAKKRESELKDRWWDDVNSKKKIANMEREKAVSEVKDELASVKAGAGEQTAHVAIFTFAPFRRLSRKPRGGSASWRRRRGRRRLAMTLSSKPETADWLLQVMSEVAAAAARQRAAQASQKK